MKSSTIFNGQEVWITGGLDNGKKGTVVSGGWGVYSVQLDSETKTFDQHSVSDTNPKSHNVPLPPSFIPLEHKVGDKVIVEGFHMHEYNGTVGTVERVPNSVSTVGFGGRAYRIRGAKTSAYPEDILDFLPKFLKPYKAVRRVGEEISHEDVQIGDIIRTELRSGEGTYSHASIKEGKVNALTRKRFPSAGESAAEVYSFSTDRHHGLTFGHKDEKIFLVKAAEDPWKAIVDGLTSGTVVVRENDNGTVSTFVKAPNSLGSSQWHVVNSSSTRSSTFVTDSDIIRILGEGKAEFVHKVRKPVIPAPPAF